MAWAVVFPTRKESPICLSVLLLGPLRPGPVVVGSPLPDGKVVVAAGDLCVRGCDRNQRNFLQGHSTTTCYYLMGNSANLSGTASRMEHICLQYSVDS
jgi:hypothetical protein